MAAKKKTVKKQRGRPTKYDWAAVFDKICGITASSSMSLYQILAADKSLPTYCTICVRLRDNDEFATQYARAKQSQADFIAEEILAIADDTANDYVTDEDGLQTLDHEHVQRSRLRIDARKWMAGKLRPKKYGEKIQQEHSGSIGLSQILDDLDGENTGLPGRTELDGE